MHLGFLRIPKGGVIEIFEFTPYDSTSERYWNKPSITHFTLDVKNLKLWHKNGNEWAFLKDPVGNLIELIDLKMNYPLIRFPGGLLGKIMKKKKFKKYYEYI